MPALRAILLTLAVALAVAVPSVAAPAGSGRDASSAQVRQAPQNSVTPPRSVRIGTLRRRGLRSPFRCSSTCRVTGRLTLGPKTAKRFGLTRRSVPVTIGTGTARRNGSGASRLTVRLTQRARRAMRRMRSGSVGLATRVRSGSARVTQEFTVRVKR